MCLVIHLTNLHITTPGPSACGYRDETWFLRSRSRQSSREERYQTLYRLTALSVKKENTGPQTRAYQVRFMPSFCLEGGGRFPFEQETVKLKACWVGVGKNVGRNREGILG